MEINTGNQLKGYIQREIKEHSMHSNYGFNYFFCRSFLERLYHEHENFFILRGSFSQFTNIGEIKRPLTDIDLITFNYIGEGRDRIESTINDSDGPIRFKIKNKFVTTNSTINYRILCHFDQIQNLISVDFKKQEEYQPLKKEMPILFSKDKPFDVNVTSLERALALKLYVVLLNFYLNKVLGKESRRLKDFYDIYTLMGQQNIDMNQVKIILEGFIQKDEFLKDFKLSDNIFDPHFIETNLGNWNEEKKKYGFTSDISLSDAVSVAEETIKHLR